MIDPIKYGRTCEYCLSVFTADHKMGKARFCSPACCFHSCYIKDKETACWVWNFTTSKGGLCTFKHRSTRYPARRFSYKISKGHIEEKFVILSTCGNKKCVNPDHLTSASGRFKDGIQKTPKKKLCKYCNHNIVRDIRGTQYCSDDCFILDRYIIIPNSNCWEWQRVKKTINEAITFYSRGDRVSVGRFLYEKDFGEIPLGKNIYKNCMNTKCINPSHVSLLTPAEIAQNLFKTDKTNKYKITPEIVKEIRQDARSTRVLGLHYRISSRTVSDIKSGKTWRNV